MVRYKYRIAFKLCPHSQCRTAVWLQYSMHLSQGGRSIGKELQSLLAQDRVEHAGLWWQLRGWRLQIFNRGSVCERRFAFSDVQHWLRDIDRHDPAPGPNSYCSESCNRPRTSGDI